MSFHSNKFFNQVIHYKNQILWTIVAILAVYFIFYVVSSASRSSHGFVSYYTASRLLFEGEKVSNFYDDGWFSSKVKKYEPDVYEIYLVNPPTTSLILLPIVPFGYAVARIFWVAFNLLLLIFTISLVINKFNYNQTGLPVVLIIFLLYQPLYANFAFGQIHILVFCLLVFAWLAYNSGKEEWLGFLIGLIFILKFSTIILWLLLPVQKKWKGLSRAFATIVLLFIVTLPWVGIESWKVFINELINYTSNSSTSVTAYQTVNSLFNHLFVFDKQWNPEPIINLPLLGKLLSLLVGVIIFAITIRHAYKFKSDLSFGTFIIAGLILSPASIDYHYVILLIPFLILFNWLRENNSFLIWLCFILLYVLTASSLPYNSPKVTEGFWAIFAYPKLYGAVGLWCLLMLVSNFTKENKIQTDIKSYQQS